MAIGETTGVGTGCALTEQLQATAPAVAPLSVEPAVEVELLRTMQPIRRVEERAEELYLAGELPGFIHRSRAGGVRGRRLPRAAPQRPHHQHPPWPRPLHRQQRPD